MCGNALRFVSACVPRGFYACLPTELDVLVDAASNAHGHDGIVPRADEHQRETQAHTQKGQSPG